MLLLDNLTPDIINIVHSVIANVIFEIGKKSFRFKKRISIEKIIRNEISQNPDLSRRMDVNQLEHRVTTEFYKITQHINDIKIENNKIVISTWDTLKLYIEKQETINKKISMRLDNLEDVIDMRKEELGIHDNKSYSSQQNEDNEDSKNIDSNNVDDRKLSTQGLLFEINKRITKRRQGEI